MWIDQHSAVIKPTLYENKTLQISRELLQVAILMIFWHHIYANVTRCARYNSNSVYDISKNITAKKYWGTRSKNLGFQTENRAQSNLNNIKNIIQSWDNTYILLQLTLIHLQQLLYNFKLSHLLTIHNLFHITCSRALHCRISPCKHRPFTYQTSTLYKSILISYI